MTTKPRADHLATTETAAWPAPYLQPNPKEDCGYYTAAYIARCLGYPDVTAEQVKAWRAETRKHEAYYVQDVLGAEVRRFWDEGDDESLGEKRSKWFWLGPGLHGWVRGWLFAGWIAHVNVHRIHDMGHAVTLLGFTAEAVLLHDPLYGHITEPWAWFAGPGPKAGRENWPGSAPDGRPFGGCHFIEGWYKAAISA